uniref:AlNc14C273G9996 protein n=1 Tax=Albugo laibachii Nc14 TaxID=890382 RepID=F0WUI5_9STRA|nr:AlNc14C273G9996 [Albugo laibachii Nc14]|eukprot:CCA25066.1 AlNc14C273G9996 [Albugo laibachii Nc14]
MIFSIGIPPTRVREVVESYIYGSCSVNLNLLRHLLFYMGDILRYKATHVVLTFWSKGLV